MVGLKTHQASILPGSEGLCCPRVSPDGLYVVGHSADALRLMLLDLTTHKAVALANAAAFDEGWPEWSRDSKYVYISKRSRPGVFRVRILDHKLEEVESLKDVRQAGVAFGPWHGLAPDDSPLMLVDTAIQEIYALDWEAP